MPKSEIPSIALQALKALDNVRSALGLPDRKDADLDRPLTPAMKAALVQIVRENRHLFKSARPECPSSDYIYAVGQPVNKFTKIK